MSGQQVSLIGGSTWTLDYLGQYVSLIVQSTRTTNPERITLVNMLMHKYIAPLYMYIKIPPQTQRGRDKTILSLEKQSMEMTKRMSLRKNVSSLIFRAKKDKVKDTGL